MQSTESRIQQDIVVWFTNQYCLKSHSPREVIFHVANEGQQHLIRIGLLPGVSDLIFTFRGQVIFCEVKTETGKQGPKQIEFQHRITALGYTYLLTRSLDEFQVQLHKLK